MRTHKFYQITRYLAVFMILFSGTVMWLVVAAQEDDGADDEFVPATIELTGAIISIEEMIITVSGLPVDISAIDLDEELSVGLVVFIEGIINEEGIIIAASLTIVDESADTPELPETPGTDVIPVSDEMDTVISIEGPIQNININIITIYNFNITVAPENPVLNLIQIGDVVRIQGGIGRDGAIVAVVVNTVVQSENVAPDASVSVQGPIEWIEGNMIVVNGITVQLDPDDPLLATLEIGNFIDVQGNFVIVNNTYVLIVVNVIVINNTYIGVPPYCYWHGMGGMGHWHCDGYWLYSPNYWYCEWRAMGMGMGMGQWECVNPAPGMGMGMGMGMGN